MRLVLIGTGAFAEPAFRQLYSTPHDVVALITSPLRQHHGKHPDRSNPVRDLAREHATPIFDPEDINDPDVHNTLLQLNADLLIVCDYGQILSAATLSAAQLGGINLHGSLLPKYRGAAPINWAIYHGETKTGVSVIHMTPKVDAGPCIAQAEIVIDPEETAVELEKRLAELGAWLVLRTMDAIKTGNLEALAQDPGCVTNAPRLKKSDGLIDWSRPGAAIKNQVRAMEPWPKTYTYWRRQDGPPMRLIFGPVAVVAHDGDSAPGTILEANDDRLLIAAGSGAVAPKSIQPVGSRFMSIAEFLRGYPVRPGDIFGPEENSPA
jgi:methionyl-tRNA formyltransferase